MYCGLLVRVQGIARFADALAFRSGTLTPSPFPLLRSVEFHALHALGVRAVSPLGKWLSDLLPRGLRSVGTAHIKLSLPCKYIIA